MSSGIGHHLVWYIVTEVSGKLAASILRVVQEELARWKNG
jgi:hypothetical protein